MKNHSPNAALQELRALVATYLEGSDDAARAADLLDALESYAPADVPDQPDPWAQEKREWPMFGCATAAIDTAIAGKEPRGVAMFAMSVLSDAQEIIPQRGAISERDANTIRQRMNIAKYAIDKAVPR